MQEPWHSLHEPATRAVCRASSRLVVLQTLVVPSDNAPDPDSQRRVKILVLLLLFQAIAMNTSVQWLTEMEGSAFQRCFWEHTMTAVMATSS